MKPTPQQSQIIHLQTSINLIKGIIEQYDAKINSGKFFAYLQVKVWRYTRRKYKARLKNMEYNLAILRLNL